MLRLLLIFLLSNSARAAEPKVICEAMIAIQDSTQNMHFPLTKQTFGQKGIFMSGMSLEDRIKQCLETISDKEKNNHLGPLKVASTKIIEEPRPLMTVEQCKTFESDNECFNNSSLKLGPIGEIDKLYADLLTFSARAPAAQQKCKCWRENLTAHYARTRNSMPLDEDLRVERKKLNSHIIESYGKKFLNSYASNLEDVNYYLINTAKIFKEGSGTSYQCSDSHRYMAKVHEKCSAKGIAKEQID